jgi:hypothetical protein
MTHIVINSQVCAPRAWQPDCSFKGMSNTQEQLVVQQLSELKALELQLEARRRRLKYAGRDVRSSFVSKLGELQWRAQRLEQLLADLAMPVRSVLH